MSKVRVEFINTCPCCVGYEECIKEVAGRYQDDVEVKVYQLVRISIIYPCMVQLLKEL